MQIAKNKNMNQKANFSKVIITKIFIKRYHNVKIKVK